MDDQDGSRAGRRDGYEQQLPPGALMSWWKQGARTALLRKPDWGQLQPTPALVAILVVGPVLLGVLLERLMIPQAAIFYWPSIQFGWLGTAVAAWCCWLANPGSRSDIDAARASPAGVFALVSAQGMTTLGASGFVLVLLGRATGTSAAAEVSSIAQAVWWISIAWVALAALTVLWRESRGTPIRRMAAGAGFVGAIALQIAIPIAHWYPDPEAGGRRDAGARPFELTQESFEGQASALERGLDALQPGRGDGPHLYSITYAPYADDVFRRESELVTSVMEERFGAAGRSLQLVNQRDAEAHFAWATPVNLKRAIERMATLMNRDRDVLFIHLTSHGARDGSLAAQFWPLTVQPLGATLLKGWLEEQGIRYRVISISACYSGTWIHELAAPGAVVMTASDSEHTSYGCGSRSPLTFFGRALYDEQLRTTWSFEEAHAAARKIIEQRERDAGKSDGYSNPQISIGDQIRPVLARLAAERALTSSSPKPGSPR